MKRYKHIRPCCHRPTPVRSVKAAALGVFCLNYQICHRNYTKRKTHQCAERENFVEGSIIRPFLIMLFTKSSQFLYSVRYFKAIKEIRIKNYLKHCKALPKRKISNITFTGFIVISIIIVVSANNAFLLTIVFYLHFFIVSYNFVFGHPFFNLG